MKRITLVAAALMLSVAPMAVASAQGFGIKGGLSYGTSNDNGVDPGATQRTGFAIGLGGETGGVVGFGFEALYAQRGFTSHIAGESRKLDYLDIPLYLRLSIPNPAVSPYVIVGPQVSWELTCNDGNGSCPSTDRSTFTYAGVIGAGVRFPRAAGMSLEARYVYGLNDLNMSTISNSSNYKTRSLVLLLGFGM